MKRKTKTLSMSKLFQKYPIEIPDVMREKLYNIISEMRKQKITTGANKDAKSRYNIPQCEIDYAVYLYFFEILNCLRNDKNISIQGFGKFSFEIEQNCKRINKKIKIIEEKIPKVKFGNWKRNQQN